MGSSTGSFRGVVPILVTPFDENGGIDESSLRNQVDWVIDAGAHGLGIALGSEIFKLTEAERDVVISIVIHEARDRVPVVVNTGAAATDLAVFYSRRAEELGAAGVMCTPPGPGYCVPAIVGYFRAISDAVTVPIVIQDTSSTPVPAGLILEIANACSRVTYAKVESTPPASQVGRAVQVAGDKVQILGGAGGSQFLQELRRGSIGTMPFPSSTRAFVDVWDLWHAGDKDAARAVFSERIQPLLSISTGSLGGAHLVHKRALQRQGVIATDYVRPPGEPLDAVTLDELDEAFVQLGWN